MICKGLIRFYSLYFQQLSRGSSLLWHVVNHGGWGRRVAQPTTQPQRWLVISSTCWHPWWWRIMSWIYPVKTNVFLASQCGNSMKTESLLKMFSIEFAKVWTLFTAGVDCQTCWHLQSPQRATQQSVWYESTMPWVQKWAPVCGVLTQRQSGLSGLQVRPPVLYRPEIGTTHWAVVRQKDRQLFRFHEE